MSSPIHPILIDTSGLIAAANTKLWPAVCDNLKLTTTNVCKHEITRHVRDKSEYAPEDSRQYQLHHGSRKTLDVMDEGDVPITTVNCVPRPHGSDAGEESLRRQLSQDSDPYSLVILMDAEGRRSIRRTLQSQNESIPVVGPPYLFYLLKDKGIINRQEFCEACGEMIDNEGWTGYKAAKAAWEGIPIDCSDCLDNRLLPL